MITSISLILILKRLKYVKNLLKDKFIIIAGLFNTSAITLAYLGQRFTIAGKAALLLNMNFLYSAILSFIILKEKPTKYKISGLILGLFGAYFLTIGFDFWEVFYAGSLLGDILILIAGFLWAAHVIATKKIYNKNNENKYLKVKNIIPLDVSCSIIMYSFCFGLIPLTIFLINDPSIIFFSNQFFPYLLLLHLGISCTSIAHLFYNKGLKWLSPAIVGIILLIEVLMANLLSIIFLPNEEYFSIDFIIGAAFIISAIVISNLGRQEMETK
jgi:drug/metabolite transporter (DMT)-like permease